MAALQFTIENIICVQILSLSIVKIRGGGPEEVNKTTQHLSHTFSESRSAVCHVQRHHHESVDDRDLERRQAFTALFLR